MNIEETTTTPPLSTNPEIKKTVPPETPPEEFKKIIGDFIEDLRVTFPEYDSFISKWWKSASYFDTIEDHEEPRNVTGKRVETITNQVEEGGGGESRGKRKSGKNIQHVL